MATPRRSPPPNGGTAMLILKHDARPPTRTGDPGRLQPRLPRPGSTAFPAGTTTSPTPTGPNTVTTNGATRGTHGRSTSAAPVTRRGACATSPTPPRRALRPVPDGRRRARPHPPGRLHPATPSPRCPLTGSPLGTNTFAVEGPKLRAGASACRTLFRADGAKLFRRPRSPRAFAQQAATWALRRPARRVDERHQGRVTVTQRPGHRPAAGSALNIKTVAPDGRPPNATDYAIAANTCAGGDAPRLGATCTINR